MGRDLGRCNSKILTEEAGMSKEPARPFNGSVIPYYRFTLLSISQTQGKIDEKENLNYFSDKSKKACHAAL
jgi:hypothetical protein